MSVSHNIKCVCVCLVGCGVGGDCCFGGFLFLGVGGCSFPRASISSSSLSLYFSSSLFSLLTTLSVGVCHLFLFAFSPFAAFLCSSPLLSSRLQSLSARSGLAAALTLAV